MLSNLMKNGVGPVSVMGSVLFTSAATLAPEAAAAAKEGASAAATKVDKVPVVTRDIDRGSIISPQDISLRKIDTDRMHRGTVLSKSDLVGLEALRNLRAGRPVRSRHVRVPPLARDGQDVTLVVRQPGLELKTAGRALEDGHEGDTIRVMTKASKEIIEARVVGNGMLVVQ